MESVGNAAETFLNSGILGAIIVVLGAVVVYLYKSREKIQEDRLNEAKQVRDTIAEPLSKLSTLIKESNDDILDAIYEKQPRKRSR